MLAGLETKEAPLAGTDFASGEWYAIRVKSKCERCVAAGLKGKGYGHFLPLARESRNWAQRRRNVERVLIPGYVFGQFDYGKRLPVLTIPGVAHIVSTSSGPCPIPADELAAVELVARSACGAIPWPCPFVGDHVVVNAGPLRGLRGVLVEIKAQARVVVSVTLLNRSVAAEVDLTCVHPAAGRRGSDAGLAHDLACSGIV